MTLFFADANSVNVTPPQDTPISNRKDGKFINFGVEVEIQKPIEKLPRGKLSLYSFHSLFIIQQDIFFSSFPRTSFPFIRKKYWIYLSIFKLFPKQETKLLNWCSFCFLFSHDSSPKIDLEKLILFECSPGTAIFFEFKHYKPKKDIVSTKCFSFIEQDEIKPGPACIELWVLNNIQSLHLGCNMSEIVSHYKI